MEMLMIETASPASARAMADVLSPFGAELLGSAGACSEVVISLGRGNAELVAVLNALEEFVTEQASGPACLKLMGHSYVMHPAPAGD